MDDKSIKENIRRKRKAKGISQENIAERMGVANSTYWEIESGSTSILNPNIWKIAEILGCTVAEIVCPDECSGHGDRLQEEVGTYIAKNLEEEVGKRIAVLEEEKDAEIDRIGKELELKNEIVSLLRRNIEDKDLIIRMKDKELAALRAECERLTEETGDSR